MMLRGIAVAAILIAGAALNIQYSNGAAAVVSPHDESLDIVTQAGTPVANVDASVDADAMAPPRMAQAPISLGNPATAAALDALTSDRTTANTTQIAMATPNADVTDTTAITTEPTTYQLAVKIKSGDTLSNALRRVGANPVDAEAAIRALKGQYDPRDLRAGQTIHVNFAPSGQASGKDLFTGFEIPLDYATRIAVAPAPNGGYRAQEIQRDLETQHVRAEGTIDWSLFQAGSDAGVPATVMAELVRAFSWDVDFQRDIRKNDGFEVMFETKVDKDGQAVHSGKIVFAALTLSGDRKPIYLHTLKDGTTDYFDEKGQSAKKALMRTPIDGARLSSHFGTRKHPILGYTKKHTGTDFAAPPGTPIYAAGDGIIEASGWNGGYGKYVRIRHNSEYSTAYAHMRAIKYGKGKRVHQGQVIGYVGTTGRSTGPHLHFEIVRRGVKVNPMRVKMPSGKKLTGNEFAHFQETRDALKTQWASLAPTTEQLAQR